jgi:hypothetical protein
LLAVSPLRATLWLVTPLDPVAVEPYDVVVPYSTTELLASLVVQVTVAPVEVMEEALTPEMVGGVVSAALRVVKLLPVLVAKFPAASADFTR